MKPLTLFIAGLLVSAATPGDVEKVVGADAVVAATVNGVPGRLRIDPAAQGMPLVTSGWAARARLKAGWFGISYAVGRQVVAGRTATARVDLGDGARKRRIGWTDLAFAPGLDGVVGPAGLKESIVRFVLRPPRPGERTTSLPMIGGGGLFSFGVLATTLDVDGQPIAVRFDPWHARTLATAGAAQRIALAREGTMRGDAVATEIAFGIERPVRTMTLGRPVEVGPLTIASLGVRTADFGDARAIPDADVVPDPDEVVVTAKGKRDRSRDRLSLGRDQLDRCSSIVFDRRAAQVRLTCG